MKAEPFDKIDRYIRGEMLSEELSFFEKEIEENLELHKELELRKDIVKNLTLRQEKLEKMALWSAKSKHSVWKRYVTIGTVGVAASMLIGVWVLRPHDDLQVSSIIQERGQGNLSFRGGFCSTDVNHFLQSGQYKEALTLIDSLQIGYKMFVYEDIPSDSLSEEQQYEREANKLAIYNLEWQKIQALIGLNQYEEALEILVEFRKENGEFQEKADSIWMRIKYNIK